MEELLPAIQTSDRTHPIHILDVGSGLVDVSNANIRKQDVDLISSGRVHLCVGDVAGTVYHPRVRFTFQAIHVEAGADELATKC
eukprot:scaffold7097_cov60-Attheya_sp.AAC.1